MVRVTSLELARYGWRKMGINLFNTTTKKHHHLVVDLPDRPFRDGHLTPDSRDLIYSSVMDESLKTFGRLAVTPRTMESLDILMTEF